MLKDKSGNSDTANRLLEKLGSLRLTLEGAVDKNDESVKQAFENLSKNEETMRKEVEDDPELHKLNEELS